MTDDTITINRQDTYVRTVNLKDENGTFIDATGWEISFTVRTSIAATSVEDDTGAIISKVIPGEASGIQTLTLTSTDTDIDPASYIYDFQVKKADDTISSSTRALFVVNGDVTRLV
jgi:hypothetical protein